MHFTLILWIFSLLSTAPGLVPTQEQIEALKPGQVIEITPSILTGQKFRYAIYFGHIQMPSTFGQQRHMSTMVKVVQFAIDLPTYIPQVKFTTYFTNVWLRTNHGRLEKLQGNIDLKVHYMPPQHISILYEKAIMGKRGMGLLKAALSVVLVNAACPSETSHVATVERINSLVKGQVIWVSSTTMYGGRPARHPFHFAIFLGLVHPQRGSTSELKIAQIVMDLPFPVPPEDTADFNEYFPITWWWRKREIMLNGNIDLELHKIQMGNILLPWKRLILDTEGVKKLEAAMAITRLKRHTPSHRCRSSSAPANYQCPTTNEEEFDESGSESSRTPVTGLTRSKSLLN